MSHLDTILEKSQRQGTQGDLGWLHKIPDGN